MHFVFTPTAQSLYLQSFKDIAGMAGGLAGLFQTCMMALGAALIPTGPEDIGTKFIAFFAVSMITTQFWFWATVGCCPPQDILDTNTEPEPQP